MGILLYILLSLGFGALVGFVWGRRGHSQLAAEVARFQTEVSYLKEKLQLQNDEFQKHEQRFSKEFENLANRIFAQSTDQITKRNQEQLSLLLNPVKDRLVEFHKTIDEKYTTEAKERFSLQREVKQLMELNQRLSEDANNLTLALKGDSKAQGDWGEFKLSQILKQAGLEEGSPQEGGQYITQGKNMELKDEEGRHQKPDIIVHLPEGKHVVIDSKVSLTAYHRYIASESEDDRRDALQQHLISIQRHVDELSAKDYQDNKNLNSPDFVFMFIPSEPAFSLALRKNPELYQRAWDKKIAITSPTTLFAVLRTIASIWLREKQTKNAIAIAEEGGKLYDKFVGFLSDLQKVGKHLSDTQKVYDEAMGKLQTGRGNLISKVDHLRKLGAKTKNRLISQDHEMPDDETSITQ